MKVPKQGNKERIVFSRNGAGTTGYLHHTKLIKDLTVRTKTIKVSEKNRGVDLYYLRLGSVFSV